MNPTQTRYHERTCDRAYGSFVRACEDGRWADALAFATEAMTLHEVGYGGTMPKGAMTHLVETVDGLSRDGVQVSALR